MTPAEREEVAKMLLAPVSINTERRSSDESTDDGRGSARDVRNKYLKRIGVGDGSGGGGNGSDHEPLLQ